MKFTVVNIGTVGNATGATLALTPVTVPKGATIFVCVTEKSTSGTDGTLADTVNTYSKLTSGSLAATAADGRGMLFAVTNAGALSAGTITYTRNLSGSAAAMSAFYVVGATGAATFTEGLASATGTTGTITVTSGSLGAGDLVLGVLFDSGSSTAGGNATFTQDSTNGAFTTPPIEIKSAAGTAQARVDGGVVFKAASGTQVYAPTMSSTAQQWFLVVLGIIPAPDSAISIEPPKQLPPRAVGEPIGRIAALLTPNPVRPFTQADWPRSWLLALPLAKAQPTDQQNLLTSTLAPTVVTVSYILRAPLFARLPDPRPKAIGEPVGTTTPLVLTAPFGSPQFSNEDLPEPVRFRANPISDLAPLSPLYFPQPSRPFVQNDWLRQPSLPKAIGEVAGTLSPILTPNPAQPFVQRLWENATRAFPKSVGEVLAGDAPLLTPNPARPFVQLEWPSAKAPAQRAVGEAAGTLNPLLTPPVAAVQYTFRGPLYARLPDQTRPAKVDDFVNPLTLRSVVVVAAPFTESDWPSVVPPRPKLPDASVAASNPLYSPNPSQPFVQSLWDLAIRAWPKVVGEAVGTLSPLLTPNPPRPFVQSIWDSATLAKPKAYAEPAAAISALYTPDPARPFSQSIWDSATRAWPKAIGEALGGDAPLLTPNPAQPFVQSDWTLILKPIGAKVDDVVNLLPSRTIVVAGPFSQDDWLNAARTALSLKSDVYGGPRTLLAPNPAQPFSQGLWELATRARPGAPDWYAPNILPLKPPPVTPTGIHSKPLLATPGRMLHIPGDGLPG